MKVPLKNFRNKQVLIVLCPILAIASEQLVVMGLKQTVPKKNQVVARKNEVIARKFEVIVTNKARAAQA